MLNTRLLLGLNQVLLYRRLRSDNNRIDPNTIHNLNVVPCLWDYAVRVTISSHRKADVAL
jgi:hypothetical protein